MRRSFPALEKPLTALSGVHLIELETDHLSDQLSALAWLRKQPFVQAHRIAVAGSSFGGIETVLGAEKGDYCAAVASAAGAESWKLAPELRTLMIRSVRNANAPIFFFQAANSFRPRTTMTSRRPSLSPRQ